MGNFASNIWNSGPFAGQPLCALLPSKEVFQRPLDLNSEDSPLFEINSAKGELDDAVLMLNRAISPIMKKLATAAAKEQTEVLKAAIIKYEKTL